MKNNYGNFVVQKVLKLSSGNYKLKLLKCMIKNIEKIGDRKLIFKWKSIIESHIYTDNKDFTLNFNEANQFNNFVNFSKNSFVQQQPNYSMMFGMPNNLNMSSGIAFQQQNIEFNLNSGMNTDGFVKRGNTQRHTFSFQPHFKLGLPNLQYSNENFNDDLNFVNNQMLLNNFKHSNSNNNQINDLYWGTNNSDCSKY
jgi:hypothetical protein